MSRIMPSTSPGAPCRCSPRAGSPGDCEETAVTARRIVRACNCDEITHELRRIADAFERPRISEAELDAVTRDRTVKIDVDKSLWSGGFKHLGAEGIPGCAGGWHQQAQSSLPLALPQAHPWAQAWGKHPFPR
jgi:hypothetical protein